MTPPRSAGAAGFSLLEAAVALVVVGIGIGGAIAATSHALRTQAGLGRHVEALSLTEERLLEVEALPRDSLPAERARTTEAPVTLGGRSYLRTTILRPDDRDALWRATVETEWGDGDRVRLETVLHRPAADPFEGRRR